MKIGGMPITSRRESSLFLREGMTFWPQKRSLVHPEVFYRGQMLESKFHLEARAEGGYDLIRIDGDGESL